ncbi:hypothetical protein GWI33_000213 [Rhynchophorus ferrugineus]|uniref:Uncharacterized protein n=1 Tax=Rhynchophorus ferrugineus TaxID=354439 RepID=A0A834MNP8_RHYFE|nr:hypothetical protein GWI33_000213 [Rhynchophorus ferrugineus]
MIYEPFKCESPASPTDTLLLNTLINYDQTVALITQPPIWRRHVDRKQKQRRSEKTKEKKTRNKTTATALSENPSTNHNWTAVFLSLAFLFTYACAFPIEERCRTFS